MRIATLLAQIKSGKKPVSESLVRAAGSAAPHAPLLFFRPPSQRSHKPPGRGGCAHAPKSGAAWVPFRVLSAVLGAAICRSTPPCAGR